MRIKYPLELEMVPEKIDAGTQWVTMRVKNIGQNNLTNLDVRLNSRDTYFIRPMSPNKFIFSLKPAEEEWLSFQVSAIGSSDVYISIDGFEKEQSFTFMSPDMPLRVIGQPAELRTLFVMTEPYPNIGETLKCEANILGLETTEILDLQIWADTPSGEFKKLADIKTKEITPGEDATYSAEITPDETGLYTVHAYLYDDTNRRIDHIVDTIYVKD